jgi:hypothetical protein
VGAVLIAGTLAPNFGATNMALDDQALFSSERRPYLQEHKSSWNEQMFGYGSWRDPKPTVIVLEEISSKLLCLIYSALEQLHAEISILHGP